VGGLDAAKDMKEKNMLKSLLAGDVSAVASTAAASPAAASGKDALMKRCGELVASAKVMLFMKGSPDAPRCGFSRTAVELLRKEGIDFASFDILEDEAVRQGLKEFSNWPTYPQLYVDGKLVGGLDVMKEMVSMIQRLVCLPIRSVIVPIASPGIFNLVRKSIVC